MKKLSTSENIDCIAETLEASNEILVQSVSMLVEETKRLVVSLKQYFEERDETALRLLEGIEKQQKDLTANVVEILNAVVDMLGELSSLNSEISHKLGALIGVGHLRRPSSRDPLWTEGQMRMIEAWGAIHEIETGQGVDSFLGDLNSYALEKNTSGRIIDERANEKTYERFFASFIVSQAEKHGYSDLAVVAMFSILRGFLGMLFEAPVFNGTPVGEAMKKILEKNSKQSVSNAEQ